MHIGFWIGPGFQILAVALSPRASFITKLLKIEMTQVIEIRAPPKNIVFGGAQDWRKQMTKVLQFEPRKKLRFLGGAQS